jgi:hypothetical protein
MVERPFYWCTNPTPTKLFIPLNYIEWSVWMLESGDFMRKLSKMLSRFVGGMHSVQSGWPNKTHLLYSNFKKTMLGHDNLTDFILYIWIKVWLEILKILKAQCCHTYEPYYKKLIENSAFYLKIAIEKKKTNQNVNIWWRF